MAQCYCRPGSDTERTPDGSLIELYRRMPPTGEPERVHALLQPQSSVLELGAGTGRIADPLAQLGHHVTAVDDSERMLAEVQHARPVCARIEDLQLTERFDAVLLMTNLIHYPGDDLRRAVLTAIARHLKPTGKGVIQWKPPPFWAVRPSGWNELRTAADVTVRVTYHSNVDGLVHGEFAMLLGESELRQCIHLEALPLERLVGELDRAGLRLTTADPESTEWLEVVHCR